MLDKTIGFIGAGKMAMALISCIYNKKIAKKIIASSRNNKNLIEIKKQFPIKTTKDNKEAVKNSDIVFICVKPQDIDEVLNEIKNVFENQLIISIAAGIKIRHIESKLGNKRIIRVMPNINCLVGEMAAGFSAGRYTTKEDINEVSKILNSAGIAFLLKEDLLDIVGAISGSGPAFLAYLIKAFEGAGVKNGLPKEIAFKLAIISNIDNDLFTLSAKHLKVEFDYIVTAEQAKSYKPSLNNFKLAIKKIGVSPEMILHIAQSIYHDIIPAKKLNLSTVWVNRRKGKEGFGATLPANASPDLEVPDLKKLVSIVASNSKSL